MRGLEVRWCVVVLGVVACRSGEAPSAAPPDAATAVAVVEPSEPPPPQEPASPWPITLLDAEGHAPLPDGPRPIVWVTMDGIAATSAAGGPHALVPIVDGRLAPADDGAPLGGLHDALAEHERKDVLEIWADERIPIATIAEVLRTSARAGFERWAFVVGEPGARGLVHVDPLKPWKPARSEGPPWADLELSWGSRGVSAVLVRRESEVEPSRAGPVIALDVGDGSCVVPGGARPDPAVVRAALDELCTVADGKRFALHMYAGEAERIGDVLSTVAADRRPESCRLPTTLDVHILGLRRSCDEPRSVREAIASFRAPPPSEDADAPYFVTNPPKQPRGPMPSVRQGKITVKGPMDADIVRRIVRAHINEVRHCYNRGLAASPGIGGRVVIAFTIDAAGSVPAAEVVPSSTLKDDTVGSCLVEAFARWKFPKPPGGVVVEVVHPFELSPK